MKIFGLVGFLFGLSCGVSAFDKIIAYADSYTDNGNDFAHSGFPPTPPYFEGRFSNGPTWLEYVDQNLTSIQFINNGHGGATTNNEDVYSVFNGFIVPGLKQQIETIWVNGTSNDLYIIYIGYNDLNAIVNPDQYIVINKDYTYKKIAQNVVEGVELLVKMYGAKEFLVLNVAPFDQWPVITSAKRAETKKLINDYNAYVQAQLVKKVHGVNFQFLDDHAWFEEQLANPGALGLSTENGACVKGIGQSPACKDSGAHFFWDYYHPEAKVHAAFGKWAIQQIKKLYKNI